MTQTIFPQHIKNEIKAHRRALKAAEAIRQEIAEMRAEAGVSPLQTWFAPYDARERLVAAERAALDIDQMVSRLIRDHDNAARQPTTEEMAVGSGSICERPF